MKQEHNSRLHCMGKVGVNNITWNDNQKVTLGVEVGPKNQVLISIYVQMDKTYLVLLYFILNYKCNLS